MKLEEFEEMALSQYRAEEREKRRVVAKKFADACQALGIDEPAAGATSVDGVDYILAMDEGTGELVVRSPAQFNGGLPVKNARTFAIAVTTIRSLKEIAEG